MSLSTTSRKAGPYAGDGATTVFAYAFKVFATSDLVVIRASSTGAETALTLGVDYTATMNGDQDASPGGNVTAAVAPAVGEKLVITSAISSLQSTTLLNGGGFFPAVLNAIHDRVTIFAQELREKFSRAVTIPITAAGVTSLQIPVSAGAFLRWNDAGTELTAGPLVASGLSVAALDAAVVHNTGVETVDGAKTFTVRFTINRSGGTIFPTYMDDASLQIVGAAASANVVHTDTFGAQGGGFGGRRANGTPAAPTGVLNHQLFCLFGGAGHDGVALQATFSGYMSVSAAEDWTAIAHGTQINWVLTPVGSTAAITVGTMFSDRFTSRRNNASDLGQIDERWRTVYAFTLDLTPAGAVSINGRLQIKSAGDGYAELYNTAGTGFTGLRFGGVTNAFPMWGRNGVYLQALLADGSDDAPITVRTVRTKSVTLAQLNAYFTAAAAGEGTRAFISDANTTLILGLGLTAVGGGANKVPVYSDGANWIIG